MDFAQALFDTFDAAVLVDKGGRVIDWNQGASLTFGFSKKEILGRSLNIIFQHNLPLPRIIQQVLPNQKKWVAETGFIRKNGAKGTCKTIMHILPPHSENKSVALISLQNITDYKNIEEEFKKSLQIIQCNEFLLTKHLMALDHCDKELRESELRFDLLAENSTDMISRHAQDGSFLYASPAGKTLLGYSVDELLTRNIYKLLHYDDVNKLKKAFNKRRDTHFHTISYRIRRKDGDYRWFESNIRIIHDENSKTFREIQMASRDITDHVMDKKARLRGQQLAHVFRLSTMEEMASGMAHEISQPLAAIVNYTQGCVRYLQKDQHDPAQIIEIMNKAVSQAERAGEVIHRLKNFFCKGQLIKTPCKINSVIRETVSFLRNDLNLSKAKIDFELSKDVPLISADKIQVQQVILNLVQNAMDAMQEINHKDRRIHIQTKPADANAIEVKVSDSGPGFSKDIITKVFKPFFTTKAHGRGMGLAICRSIIEAHGGQFFINPNTNNQSWIRFTLPI